MRRDQRAQDNWALLYAQDLALAGRRPLAVAFCLVPEFLGAARRQYAFMLAGLRETARELSDLRIPFWLLQGDPVREVPALVERVGAGALVTDFNPLHVSRRWEQGVSEAVDVPVHVVDAHNVVPVWRASDKQEYAARTIRPKLQRLLPEFLTDIPAVRAHPVAWPGDVPAPDWESAGRGLEVGAAGAPVTWRTPGPRAAAVTLAAFLAQRLAGYDTARNDPNAAGQSELSPYLHFGHLAPQRAAFQSASWVCAASNSSRP
jgi:deoxyribodipyrimidine photo-lyase